MFRVLKSQSIGFPRRVAGPYIPSSAKRPAGPKPRVQAELLLFPELDGAKSFPKPAYKPLTPQQLSFDLMALGEMAKYVPETPREIVRKNLKSMLNTSGYDGDLFKNSGYCKLHQIFEELSKDTHNVSDFSSYVKEKSRR